MKLSAWQYAAVAGALLTASYFAVPTPALRDGIYSLAGLASVVCMMAGVRMHRPPNASGWFAMASSNLCFVAGDAVYSYYELALHRSPPFPSVADAVYLPGYVFLVVAVIRLTPVSQRHGVREDRTDAAIVTVGALALLWHVLMGSYARDSSMSAIAKLITMAYPIMDIGVLFIVVNALLLSSTRRTVHTMIAVAMGSMMIGDLSYDILLLHGTYQTGSIVDAGWLISYTALAVAALHPSMSMRQSSERLRSETRWRLPLVTLAGFIVPGILLVSGLTSAPVDLTVLALCSMVLFGLVALRVVRLLNRLSQQTRDLRDALTAQQRLQEHLQHQAFHDALTGLANRALFHDRVDHALHAAERSKANVTVLVCDLDGFKRVNDSLGHNVGDQLLVAVSARLRSVVRPGDTAARLGGDEFAILIDDVADHSVALDIAHRVVTELRQPVEVAGQTISVSVSIGIASALPGHDVEQLLSEADAAMYAAKGAGKDRVQRFEEGMLTQTLRQMELRNSFAIGLHHGEFYLEYQPYISLDPDRLEGFEALVRWRHPIYGVVAPTDFIPLAEETGFIVPLGRWILETACAAAASWPTVGGRPLTVSVNVSARQLQDNQLIDDVRAVLAYSGVSPDRLVLEVTESMLMADPNHAAAVLADIKAMGIRLAIDDFGTGYSSLSYLQQFPIDVIKIDKSFIDPLTGTSDEGRALIASIIRLAHDLNLTTVAEGIELRVQQQTLIDLGCDMGQGYLLSRPMNAQAAIDFAETMKVGARPAKISNDESYLDLDGHGVALT